MATLHLAALARRSYRLTDLGGERHPFLDDVYDSYESAWSDALDWWINSGHSPSDSVPIGVEVSTPQGHWRTLQAPCQEQQRTLLFPSCPLRRRYGVS